MDINLTTMKLCIKLLFAAIALGSLGDLEVAANPICGQIAPETLEDVAVKVTYEGEVPAINTDEGSYNMMVAENFDDFLIFIDQKEGILYKYAEEKRKKKSASGSNSEVQKIYDVTEDIVPHNLQLDIAFPPFGYSPGKKKIHNVAPGPTHDTIIVVFTSASLPNDNLFPEGVSVLELPTDFEYNLEEVGNCTDITVCFGDSPPLCCFGQTVYKLFYKFKFNSDSADSSSSSKSADSSYLSSPELFFALEMQTTFGHDGGAMITIPDDGRILYGVGDCLPYGLNGLYASQDADSHCGKMLLIDPTSGSYDIVASGIRNSQQMNLEGDDIVFMEIGGVSAEEVNAIPLADLLDPTHVDNFGWGMVREESRNGTEFGREGTFAVGRGEILQFSNPPCLGGQTKDEAEGFITPYMQFGRGPGVPLFGITSSVISEKSFHNIKVAASEFNTGTMIVALEDVDKYAGQPAQSYFVDLYKEAPTKELVPLEDGFNTLVVEALNLDPQSGDSIRGDSRLFKYPDGSAGVFIERTGQFFRLSEICSRSGSTSKGRGSHKGCGSTSKGRGSHGNSGRHRGSH